MKPAHVLRDSDHSMLQMENQLLIFEVRHLRARLAAAERAAAGPALKKRAEQLTQAHKTIARVRAARDLEVERRQALLKRVRKTERALERARQRNEQASGDIRSLLTRLESSPLRPVLRRKRGYRVLVERYLGGPAE